MSSTTSICYFWIICSSSVQINLDTATELEIMATRAKKIFNTKNVSSLKVVCANGSSDQTTLTNWDDMIACGMPRASVENAYQSEFGKKPEQVHLNDDFCKEYMDGFHTTCSVKPPTTLFLLFSILTFQESVF